MILRGSPIHSMSGFGRGTSVVRGIRVTCEIRTVNQRGLDVSLSLPDGMLWADPLLRRLIAAAVHRGRVDASIAVTAAPGGAGAAMIDFARAERCARELKSLARRLGLGVPRADAVLAVPGVLRDRAGLPPASVAAPAVRKAFEAAMGRLLSMRRREGAALARDIGRRFELIEGLARRVRGEWPLAAARQQDRMAARLKEALDRMGEDRRAARDIVQAVERGDVSEELTRITSHLAQCRSALAGGSPVGRKLEFLVQELQREANTTGSKSADAALTRTVVAMKEEVERVREQVANIE